VTGEFTGATFTLAEPNAGEELFAILRLRSQDGKDVSGDPDDYSLTVGVD
jgi:hypothetical protein